MKELTLEKMEATQGGMPCKVALALYSAAFVSACLATGGLAVGLGLVGMGGAIWETIESCRH